MRLSLAALVMASLLPATQAQAEPIRLAAWNINNLNDVAGVALRDHAPIRANSDYDLLNQYRAQLNPCVIALQDMGNPKAAARIFPPEMLARRTLIDFRRADPLPVKAERDSS